MLVQFSVENYLSINEEQILSLLATRDSQHASHLISDTPRKGDSILRAAAIYGANGSGKSNLVKAMKFAQDFVLTGTRGNQAILTRPFKLRADLGAPSKFEFIFKTQGVVYNYGFRLDSARILEEWLFATPKTQEVLLFQRATSESGQVEVEFGPSFTERTAKHKQFLEFVAEGTRPNQLFVTEAWDRNVPAVLPLMAWFRSVLLIISAEQLSPDLEFRAYKNPKLMTYLRDFLRESGTGIASVATERLPLPPYPGDFSDVDSQLRILHSEDGDVIQTVSTKLLMRHNSRNENSVSFEIDEESDGTQRLIHLGPALFSLTHEPEKVLVLDELDRRLHTLVSRMIIETGIGRDNAHQNQLVFTTHDTNLLDLDLLRRDEIWFMEKEASGASRLYSLAEFKIRTDLKIEKGYLAGRFGAIPFAADTTKLGWNEQSQSAAPEPCRELAESAA
jgi:AAA15 family ATPase/GTPase